MEDHEAKIAVGKESTEAGAGAAMVAMAFAAAGVVAFVFFMGNAPAVAIVGMLVRHKISERRSI